MLETLKKSPMETKTKKMPFIMGEELVPVREAQKNITKYFDKGIVRVTKNGKSLGYLIADETLAELIEYIESSNPEFIAEMEAEKKTKKRIPLQKVLGDYSL
jgi:predicted DNA-binding transcriptional regulator